MTPATLVIGGNTAAREAAIAAMLTADAGRMPDAVAATAVILEGLPDGSMTLDNIAGIAAANLVRIAPGCMCCVGNLTLKVTLNRLLRRAPQRIFISLATVSHLDRIRAWLSHPPYDALLALTDDLRV